MTIDKRETVTMPKYLVIILFPLILGGIGGVASSMFALGGKAQQIEVNTRRLDIIENNTATKEAVLKVENATKDKVDRNEFSLIVKQLDRIEGKVDIHVGKTSIK